MIRITRGLEKNLYFLFYETYILKHSVKTNMKKYLFFPICKQYDSMQCGIACLQMICKYYGQNYSLDELSEYCFATNEGVSLSEISKAAEKIGLRTTCGKIEYEKLQEAPLPCILHWNQNHFIVLYKIKKEKQLYIADPGRGLITYSKNEFTKHWISTKSEDKEKGIAMFLQPTTSFKNEKNKEKNKQSFLFLLEYFKQYKRYFFQIILGFLIGSLLQLIFPFLTQAIVDVGIKNQNLDFIWLVLIGQLMLTASRTAVDFIRRWLLLHISIRINISLVSDFFIKLLKLPMSSFDTKLLGDFMQRMNDHSRIESFLTNQTLNIMFSFLSFFVFGIVLFNYNHLVFEIFILGSILYGAWIAIFLQKRKTLDYELFEKQAINNNKTYEFLTSMQEIKLQDCEQRRRWEWEDVQADMFSVEMKVLKLQQTQQAGSIFINELKNIIITVISATAVIHNELTLGMMLAIQYIIGQLNGPIEQLMNFIYALQDVKISLERINEIHGKENEEKLGNQINYFEDTTDDLSFNHIEFKYALHNPKKTIDNISFHIPKSKITAIVGASGSGKTTLIKLLLGYYPVLSGSVMIGKRNISEFNLKWWRRQCGVVMQDGVIFSETIARNIAVDDGDIDKKRLMNAVEIANIKEYIMQLPLKFNTKIGRDGIGLSQGQKQRIFIARAVYKNPRYIFLDEATNSLDAKNERVIVENLSNYYKGHTVIVVAHRLSTVKNADQIIVLDRGTVVEIGHHSSLIKKHGAYYNLIKNQLELGY